MGFPALKQPALPFIPKDLLALRNSFCGADTGAGAAVYTFSRIDPAFAVFFADSFNRAFAVTGATVHAGISYFISHSIPH